jgi:hypothetical protein
MGSGLGRLIMKTIFAAILAVTSISVHAIELNLEPIREIPNINNTTNWMHTTKLSPVQEYNLERLKRWGGKERTDVCSHTTNYNAKSLCEASIEAEYSGLSAVMPVKLMIQSAIVEINTEARSFLIEYAAELAKTRMTKAAFDNLVDQIEI